MLLITLCFVWYFILWLFKMKTSPASATCRLKQGCRDYLPLLESGSRGCQGTGDVKKGFNENEEQVFLSWADILQPNQWHSKQSEWQTSGCSCLTVVSAELMACVKREMVVVCVVVCNSSGRWADSRYDGECGVV
jgi:hypothetical protein